MYSGNIFQNAQDNKIQKQINWNYTMKYLNIGRYVHNKKIQHKHKETLAN